MDLLPLVCLCVLTWSRRTFVDADGPLITTITVEEDNDVVLPCSFGTSDISNKHFDWSKDGQKKVFSYQSGDHYNNGLTGQDVDFRGRVSHFPDSLQSGNASIRINTVKVSDKGIYSCDFPSDGGLRSQIELVVGTCPQPSVTTRKTPEGVLLECEVKHASPEPEVKWQDSDGNTVPSKDPQMVKNGEYSDIILQAAVTKEGDYQCVVKQTEICHQVLFKETFWQSPGSHTRDVTIGVIIAVIITFIITAGFIGLVIFVLVKTGKITIICRNGSESPKPGEEKELNSHRSDL